MAHKLHAERKLPYPSTTVWTLCGRHLDNHNQIAALEDGVTCGSCRKAIEWSREIEEYRKRRQEQERQAR